MGLVKANPTDEGEKKKKKTPPQKCILFPLAWKNYWVEAERGDVQNLQRVD